MLRITIIATALLTFAACGAETGPDAVLALEGDAAAGEELYTTHCSACHGDDGNSGTVGEDIAGEGDEEMASAMWNGKEDGEMPSFQETLTEQEMADIIAYVNSL